MPYIKQHRRESIEEWFNPLRPRIHTLSPGEINYLITQILEEQVKVYSDGGYRGLALILGGIEAVKMEFYRRRIAPYEDAKAKENGDVYA